MRIEQLRTILQDCSILLAEMSSSLDCREQIDLIERLQKQIEAARRKIYAGGSEASRLMLIINTLTGHKLFSPFDYIAPVISLTYSPHFSIETKGVNGNQSFNSIEEFQAEYKNCYDHCERICIFLPIEQLREAELLFSVLTELNVEERLKKDAADCDYYIIIIGAQANIQNSERKYINWMKNNLGHTSHLIGVINAADQVDTTVFVSQNLEGFLQDEYFRIIECIPEAKPDVNSSVEQGFLRVISELLEQYPDVKHEKIAIMLKHMLIELRDRVLAYKKDLTGQEDEIIGKLNEFERSWTVFESNCKVNSYRVSFIISEEMKNKLYQDIEDFIACIEMKLETEMASVQDKYHIMYFIEDYLQYLLSEFILTETELLKDEIYDQYYEYAQIIKSAYLEGFGEEVPEELDHLLDFNANRLLSTDMVYAGEFDNGAKLFTNITLNITVGILRGFLSYHFIKINWKTCKKIADILGSIMDDVVDKLSTKSYILKTVKKNMSKTLDEQAASMKYVYSQNLIPMLNHEMQNAYLQYTEQINHLIQLQKEELSNSLSYMQDREQKINESLLKVEALLEVI